MVDFVCRAKAVPRSIATISPPNVVAFPAHNDPRRHETMSIVASCAAAAATAAASARPPRARRPNAASSSASVASRADRTATPSGRRVRSRALWRDEDAASDATSSAGRVSGIADDDTDVEANTRGVASALALAVSAATLAPVGFADLFYLFGDTDAGGNRQVLHTDRFFIPSARAEASLSLNSPPPSSPLPSVEVPAALDPWRDGRARKAAERRAAAESADTAFRREAEKRAENERLSTAYYAKAAAIRKAKAAAERDGLVGAEADAFVARAGSEAFERAALQLSDEAYELRRYEERQRALRETAEARNAEALAAAAKADEEAARLAAAAAELESMRKECVGADSPLVAPGSVLCT